MTAAANPLDLEIAATCRRLADLLEHRAQLTGQSDIPAADPIEAKLAELRSACKRKPFRISVDDYVREDVAAELLGRSPATLKNWRGAHRPIAFRKNGRVEYGLIDLAKFLVDTSAED